jgi:hypothetical protein
MLDHVHVGFTNGHAQKALAILNPEPLLENRLSQDMLSA